jgi:hypothetical protein
LEPGQHGQYALWIVAVVALGVELMGMICFAIIIRKAMNKKSKYLANSTFKMIRYNIYFSDFFIELILTIITAILTYHLDYTTFGGISLVYISTVASVIVSGLELCKATQLEKFTVSKIEAEERKR